MKKIKIEIKHWVTGAVLFEYETENNTLAKTIWEANLWGANLWGANLIAIKPITGGIYIMKDYMNGLLNQSGQE